MMANDQARRKPDQPDILTSAVIRIAGSKWRGVVTVQPALSMCDTVIVSVDWGLSFVLRKFHGEKSTVREMQCNQGY